MKENENKYDGDIAIVGGGIIGSCLACLLGQAGFKVILLDVDTKPKKSSIRISELFRVPSSAAVNNALVALIGILLPSPTGPPDHPVLTSQQFTSYLKIRSFNKLPYSDGCLGIKGAPKQAEKVASGSSTPFSVPATLAV